MCGIAGFIDANHSGYDMERSIHQMTNAIQYRGPDASGHWVDRDLGVALGHRRLSILELSDKGAQPMFGEGGNLVGAKMQGHVLVIDDVITAGTAIKESVEIITQHQATLAGVVIALDRQERGQSALSSIQEIEQQYQVPVISIIKLEHILTYVEQHADLQNWLPQINHYRQQYGI